MHPSSTVQSILSVQFLGEINDRLRNHERYADLRFLHNAEKTLDHPLLPDLSISTCLDGSYLKCVTSVLLPPETGGFRKNQRLIRVSLSTEFFSKRRKNYTFWRETRAKVIAMRKIIKYLDSSNLYGACRETRFCGDGCLGASILNWLSIRKGRMGSF